MRINFSTVEVPPNEVNLAHTQWFRFTLPVDKSADFNNLISEDKEWLRAALKDSNGDLSILRGREESFKTLRHFRAFQKMGAIQDLIAKELREGSYEKVVVFAKHADIMKYIQISLHEFKPCTFYLKSNPRKIEQNFKRFNKPNGSCHVFISNIHAAAQDFVSFPTCNFAFFLEEDLDPAINAKAISKLYGDKIYVRNFCLSDPLDKDLSILIREKTLLQIGEHNEQIRSSRATEENVQC